MTNQTYVLHEHDVPNLSWNPRAVGPGRSNVVRTQTRVTRTDTSIVVSRQELREGQSAEGKEWTRWQTVGMNFLKAKPIASGEIRVNSYNKTYVSRYGRTQTWIRANTSTPRGVEAIAGLNVRTENLVLDFIEEFTGYRYIGMYGDRAFRSLLPAVNLWYDEKLLPQRDINVNFLVEAMRQKTIEDFVRVQYGKTRYRKDLVRAVAGAPLNTVNTMAVFKGAVPIDWQIEALRMNEDNTIVLQSMNRESARNFRRILAGMTDPRRRNFVLGLARATDAADVDNQYRKMMIDDTFRSLQRYDVSNAPRAVFEARNFHELHNALMPAGRYGQWNATPYVSPPPPKNVVIPTSKATDTINALCLSPYHFQCAVDSNQMYKWGDYMGNCISSYTSKAKSQAGIYIGLYEGEKLIGNIELDHVTPGKYEIRQILGKYNKNLPDDVRLAATKALLSTGFVTVGRDAWGIQNMDLAIMNNAQVPPAMPMAIHIDQPAPAPVIRYAVINDRAAAAANPFF